eukprot:augustus_masked-scaffold_20-processed-gene-4.11-mRNA-1 protein AED:1.00 eAED:1.00 QI:0/-1/0/0/-1/1/1/0/275
MENIFEPLNIRVENKESERGKSYDVNDPKSRFKPTTGWTVWSSSHVLLMLLQKQNFLKCYLGVSRLAEVKHTCLVDMSGGLGLVACSLTKYFQEYEGGNSVLITEAGEEQLERVRHNIRINQLDDSLALEELFWGNKKQMKLLREKLHLASFSKIFFFANDLVYIGIRESILHLLEETINQLLKITKTAEVWLLFEQRSTEQEEAFIGDLKKMNILVEPVPLGKYLHDDDYEKLLNFDKSMEPSSSLGLDALMYEKPEFSFFILKNKGYGMTDAG